jgi:hypothetical protein
VCRAVTLLAPTFVFVVAMLSTYRPSADGDRLPYALMTLGLAGLSLSVFGAARLTAAAEATWLPWLAVAVVLMPFAGLHALRIVHPVRRGVPYLRLRDSFEAERIAPAWDIATDVPVSVAAGRGGIQVDIPPASRASLEPPPPVPAWWNTFPASLLLPPPFNTEDFGERLEWRLSVERARTYFVLVESDSLLLQLAPYGVHVTVRGQIDSDAAEVASPALADGTHNWSLTRDGGLVSLAADGGVVWQRKSSVPFGRIRFGETRSDALHGGRMRLESVAYDRWWQPLPARS